MVTTLNNYIKGGQGVLEHLLHGHEKWYVQGLSLLKLV